MIDINGTIFKNSSPLVSHQQQCFITSLPSLVVSRKCGNFITLQKKKLSAAKVKHEKNLFHR